MAQAWIIVVGVGRPLSGSGIVFGTCTGLPSTFTVIVSTTGGAAGLVSVCAPFDIYATPAIAPTFSAGAVASPFAAPLFSSSDAPLATNSSLNFPTKLWTGQEHA